MAQGSSPPAGAYLEKEKKFSNEFCSQKLNQIFMGKKKRSLRERQRLFFPARSRYQNTLTRHM
jgi:hypothetical protein